MLQLVGSVSRYSSAASAVYVIIIPASQLLQCLLVSCFSASLPIY